MKERWRITVPSRRSELAAILERKLREFEEKRGLLIHTYPHRSVAPILADAIIFAEKEHPRFWRPDAHRATRLTRVISNAHDNFDRANRWRDLYPYDESAKFLADAIPRFEVER